MKKLTYKVFLDERKAKQDGSFAISIRVTYDRQSTTISTGLSAFKDEWQKDKTRLRKTTRRGSVEVMQINNHITKRTGKISELSQTLLLNDAAKKLSHKEVFSMVKSDNKSTDIDFFAVLEKMAELVKQDERVTKHTHCQSTISMVQKFIGCKSLPIKDITYDFLNRYERYYLQGYKTSSGELIKRKLSGLATQMWVIRDVIKTLIFEGKYDERENPFRYYKVKKGTAEKRGLSVEKIRRILELSIEAPHLIQARDYFMACYFLQGASFADIAQLKLSNISDGLIRYNRAKNKRPVIIPITATIKAMLSPYLVEKTNDDYVFPILLNKKMSNTEKHATIQKELAKTNNGLKTIAKMAGLSEKVTTYYARHSYATNLIHKGVSVAAVRQAMSHKDLSMTSTYIADFDNSTMGSINESLFADVSTNISQTKPDVKRTPTEAI